MATNYRHKFEPWDVTLLFRQREFVVPTSKITDLVKQYGATVKKESMGVTISYSCASRHYNYHLQNETYLTIPAKFQLAEPTPKITKQFTFVLYLNLPLPDEIAKEISDKLGYTVVETIELPDYAVYLNVDVPFVKAIADDYAFIAPKWCWLSDFIEFYNNILQLYWEFIKVSQQTDNEDK